jgi:hypothetical protein
MKRLIGTAFALLLATFTFAQVSVGFKAGVNYANISTPDLSFVGIPSTDANRSLTFGAVAEIGIKDGFAIQPELNFSKKGFEIQQGIPIDLGAFNLPVGVKAVTDLNYVEVPVLGKYSFGNEKMGAYVIAGPTMGYATSARFRTVASLLIDINIVNEKFDLDALNVSRFDIGGTIGAGATMNLGNTKWFVDARYTHGFRNLDNIPVIDLDFKNTNFALTTGIMIPLSNGYGPRA